jgi:type I restriction enzyme, S subunit
MDVSLGYKQTDVGLIPHEWSLDYIENIADITTGSKNTQDRVLGGQYPFFVRSQSVERINSYSFDGEAVLTAGDGVGTGKVFHYIDGKFDAHQRVYQISNFGAHVNGFYFFLYFSTHFYERIMKMTAKSSVDSVRREMIARMLVPLPPTKDEQDAIAKALSDADALIESLEQLITKKRHIKQGVMQELLAGKKRLMGFSGAWETKRIGDIAVVRDGTHQTPKYTESGVPFFSVENVTSGDFTNTKFISVEEHRLLTKSFKMEKGDILMTRIGSIGDCKLIDWNVEASFYVSLALLKVRTGFSAPFICHYAASDFFKREIELNSLQSAIPMKINLGPISNIRVQLPTDIAEQDAIAIVLSDMDTELAALEQKLTKARQIKQGMMANLLTGKIRLV